MRDKQELLKREGEKERDAGSLSIYTRWGGVIRDDGNIKSGTVLKLRRENLRFKVLLDAVEMFCDKRGRRRNPVLHILLRE